MIWFTYRETVRRFYQGISCSASAGVGLSILVFGQRQSRQETPRNGTIRGRSTGPHIHVVSNHVKETSHGLLFHYYWSTARDVHGVSLADEYVSFSLPDLYTVMNLCGYVTER
jgi:hypothetical protein